MKQPVSNWQKETVAIICADEMSTLETIALRGLLEYLGYVVQVYWIGTKEQLLDIFAGKIATPKTIVLSAHGTEGKLYVLTDESIPIANLHVHLPEKNVISLGCCLGTDEFGQRFMEGKCKTYIAPAGWPEGNDSLVFTVLYFWSLIRGMSHTESWNYAKSQIPEGSEFSFFEKTAEGFTKNGTRIPAP